MTHSQVCGYNNVAGLSRRLVSGLWIAHGVPAGLTPFFNSRGAARKALFETLECQSLVECVGICRAPCCFVFGYIIFLFVSHWCGIHCLALSRWTSNSTGARLRPSPSQRGSAAGLGPSAEASRFQNLRGPLEKHAFGRFSIYQTKSKLKKDTDFLRVLGRPRHCMSLHPIWALFFATSRFPGRLRHQLSSRGDPFSGGRVM